MKGMAICGIPNDIKMLSINNVTVGPEDIIIKPKRIGLCATNVKMAGYGHYAIDQRGLPFVEGHEVAGEIVEVGKDIHEYKIGDRVAVYIYIPCHNCYECINGCPAMCENFILDSIYPGGWAEYVRVSKKDNFKRRIFPLKEGVSYDEGALLEPLSCVVQSIDLSKVQMGKNVVVIGSGFMGLLHLQILSHFILNQIICIDLSDFRLDLAKKLGATSIIKNNNPEETIQKVLELTNGKGADVVFEVTGNVQAYELAVNLAAKNGKVLFFGGTQKGKIMKIESRDLHYKMLQLIGIANADDQHVAKAMKIINNKQIKLSELITHRYPLEELKEAILYFQNPDNRERILKIMFNEFSS